MQQRQGGLHVPPPLSQSFGRRLRGASRASVLRAQSATIKIATAVTPPSIHNIYMHVAYAKGLFKDNGITVSDFIQLRGGPLANQAIRRGRSMSRLQTPKVCWRRPFRASRSAA